MTIIRLLLPESPLVRVVPVLRAPHHGVRPRLHRRRLPAAAPAGQPARGTALLGTDAPPTGQIVDVRA